jgi:hypothetical protein
MAFLSNYLTKDRTIELLLIRGYWEGGDKILTHNMEAIPVGVQYILEENRSNNFTIFSKFRILVSVKWYSSLVLLSYTTKFTNLKYALILWNIQKLILQYACSASRNKHTDSLPVNYKIERI